MRAPVVVGLAVGAATTYLAVTDPYRPGGHVVCPLLALTGLYCPGCGAQRAVHSLAHGDVAAAWDMNPLLVLLAPVAVVVWSRWLALRARPGSAGSTRGRARGWASAASAWVLLTVVVAFAVGRNVPALAPLLAP